MFFSVGLLCLVLASVWWFAMQVARVEFGSVLEPALPGLILHGGFMLFLVFTPFMFGFLVTVFPRWQQAPPLRDGLCRTAFVLLLIAAPMLALGIYLSRDLLLLGWFIYCTGWALVLGGLFFSWLRAPQRVSHSAGVLAGLGVGLLASLLYGWMLVEGRFELWPVISSLGLWGFLVTTFFTVSHRMVPFFTSCVVSDYKIWRPDWLLATFVLAALARAAANSMPRLAWLPMVGMTCIAVLLAVRWLPRVSHGNRLLSVLHISVAWLVMGLVLQLCQDLGSGVFGVHWLGRAPLHALSIGFFGSMLVSMITRVTMGHSGRPLAMNRVGWWIFLTIQLGAVARVAAELVPVAGSGLNVIAAGAWAMALAAWALIFGPMYFQARIDGRPG
jgi:uncharacterized protein involved in response to NO